MSAERDGAKESPMATPDEAQDEARSRIPAQQIMTPTTKRLSEAVAARYQEVLARRRHSGPPGPSAS